MNKLVVSNEGSKKVELSKEEIVRLEDRELSRKIESLKPADEEVERAEFNVMVIDLLMEVELI